MKILPFLVSLYVIASCGTQKEVVTESTETTPITMKVVKVKAEQKELTHKTDPFSILAVEVRGNLLYVDVEFSGGCEEHSFEVNGSPMIAKSLPPIRSIEIVHNSNGDACRKLEQVKLEIDIRELAYHKEKGSEIYLALDGYKDKIKYTYE